MDHVSFEATARRPLRTAGQAIDVCQRVLDRLSQRKGVQWVAELVERLDFRRITPS